ncbi:hypothetical protein ACFZBU_33450 [Embleya sp. NPDC008237]|uniref:hypothetical protein n=1 Tax=Embleya sp. NPDC008237 TaxID=3363978 RepID=UPI0036EFC50D
MLLYDHRCGGCKDLGDEEALRAALVEAYGEALAWQDLDSLVAEFMDTRADAADRQRYFLNQETAASSTWLAPAEWAACRGEDKALHPGDTITLGFDRSIRQDSTALVARRALDGHLVLLGCWERPDEPEGTYWRVSTEEVDAAVARAFEAYNVFDLYCDPSRRHDYVDHGSAEYGQRLQIHASRSHPVE